MASLKISVQDRKDLDKFTKFLALKAAQIIVQSRLGEKIQTQGKPYTSVADWFNLAVQDLPDVLAEAKQAISSDAGTTRLPLCVEISLRTSEGDTMVLETWCLNSFHEQYDPATRATYTVYNRMGILLKSLVSVTRVTPAYKLSRRQSPDSYVICYRIYMGEPQLHNLGDGYKQVRVGQICTPIGTLLLNVAYRTKMTISPTHNGSNNSIMLKSDHFKTEADERNAKNDEDNYVMIMNKPLKRGVFIDPAETGNHPPVSPKPFEKLFEKGGVNFRPNESETIGKKTSPSDASVTSVTVSQPKPVPKPLSLNIAKKKELPDLEEFRPLVMPFAHSDKNDTARVSELYWSCKEAPTLESFKNGPTIGEQNLLGEIEKYQKELPTYDALVKRLWRSSKGEDESDDDDDDHVENLNVEKSAKCKKQNRKETQNGEMNNETDRNENSSENRLPNEYPKAEADSNNN